MLLLTLHSNVSEATCMIDNNQYFWWILLHTQNARDRGSTGVHTQAPFVFICMDDIKEAGKKNILIFYAVDTGLASSVCSFYHECNICEIYRNIND